MEMTTLYVIFTFVALILVLMGLIEVFFIPGTSVLGIVSTMAFVSAIYYLWMQGAWGMMVFFIALSLVLFLSGFYFLSRSRWVDRMSLLKSIDDKAVDLPVDLSIGVEGVADSRLALTGRVRVGSELFEATSESGFIDEKTPIVVTRIERDKVFVQAK